MRSRAPNNRNGLGMCSCAPTGHGFLDKVTSDLVDREAGRSLFSGHLINECFPLHPIGKQRGNEHIWCSFHNIWDGNINEWTLILETYIASPLRGRNKARVSPSDDSFETLSLILVAITEISKQS